jgi:hypothetical protein
MLDRDADMLAACERLFNAHLEAKADERAAYWAFFHGFRLFALREVSRANAWLQRAQHLVDGLARESAVSGYLLLPAIHKQLAAGDDATAANQAAHALVIGERCAEPDLMALARCLLGRAWVRQGQVEAGIAQLDEACWWPSAARCHPWSPGSCTGT